MTALKQKMAKTGARAWLLAVVAVAALAVSGIGASSASAACEGKAVQGEGSSLQADAQSAWTGAFNGGPGCTDKVTYNGSDESTAIWGSETGTEINREVQYLGTEEAPDAEEITNIKTAAGAESHLRVIPVAQAAIAVIAHPPTNCTVTKITRANLEKVFHGTITNWSELAKKTEHVAGACNVHIKRVVFKNRSGTTRAFKRYLFMVNTKKLDCVNKTWKELARVPNNKVWPESCEGTTLNTIGKPAARGGRAVAETVLEDEGTIGYVDTATAKKVGNQILEVQNGEEESYALPYTEAGGKQKSNCGSATYTVPAEARETGTGEDVEWTEVTGSALETPTYPICTLAYDLAFRNYSKAGFGEGFATTVKEYLEYVLGAAGQAELEENWYAPLPTGIGASTNVLTAAKFATEGIE